MRLQSTSPLPAALVDDTWTHGDPHRKTTPAGRRGASAWIADYYVTVLDERGVLRPLCVYSVRCPTDGPFAVRADPRKWSRDGKVQLPTTAGTYDPTCQTWHRRPWPEVWPAPHELEPRDVPLHGKHLSIHYRPAPRLRRAN